MPKKSVDSLKTRQMKKLLKKEKELHKEIRHDYEKISKKITSDFDKIQKSKMKS